MTMRRSSIIDAGIAQRVKNSPCMNCCVYSSMKCQRQCMGEDKLVTLFQENLAVAIKFGAVNCSDFTRVIAGATIAEEFLVLFGNFLKQLVFNDFFVSCIPPHKIINNQPYLISINLLFGILICGYWCLGWIQ